MALLLSFSLFCFVSLLFCSEQMCLGFLFLHCLPYYFSILLLISFLSLNSVLFCLHILFYFFLGIAAVFFSIFHLLTHFLLLLSFFLHFLIIIRVVYFCSLFQLICFIFLVVILLLVFIVRDYVTVLRLFGCLCVYECTYDDNQDVWSLMLF